MIANGIDWNSLSNGKVGTKLLHTFKKKINIGYNQEDFQVIYKIQWVSAFLHGNNIVNF